MALICRRSGVQLSATSATRGDYKANAIFDQIENQLKQNGAEYVKKVKGIFCFKVKKGNDTGVFVVDAKNGNGSVKFDPNGKEIRITCNIHNILVQNSSVFRLLVLIAMINYYKICS